MQKIAKFLIFFLLILMFTLSSCATVLGGKVSDCQRTKPNKGTPSRKIRVVALLADLYFGVVPLIIDFATGAIYQPCNK